MFKLITDAVVDRGKINVLSMESVGRGTIAQGLHCSPVLLQPTRAHSIQEVMMIKNSLVGGKIQKLPLRLFCQTFQDQKLTSTVNIYGCKEQF